ncbi:acyltransferase domain-containing protein [Actinacidiphila paucisporea]|uniref:Malonyl CoA-acyl carrier protein transacylase n=1 Tax=Actinacidiphila paucisporea TaxID=310782 RepID=A0A1M7NWY0_9ACTN|nr:acyltransferase domain-containing protein [Actinacidiphila paucisporea]SHN08610.1 Malonyl CoA-acyl carrier protein transacylase [Actinacidiphila paucisporea]
MGERREVALVFPGQGGQQPRMGADLYGAEAAFTAVMDDFFTAAGTEGKRLRDDWLAEDPGPEFDDCSRAQPLLFAVGAALAFAVIARGLRPTVLVGHSVGELAAAAVAGVFSVADGSRVMAARTSAMAATEPGGMLAVAAGVDRVREVLGDLAGRGLAVAAVNSPLQTVLSGATAPLLAAERALTAEVVACRPVKARQAFHSPLCAGAAARFREQLHHIRLRPPAITIRSTSTARDVTDAESVTPEFWSAQLTRPVLFWPAVDGLLGSGSRVFLEAGPKGSCAAALRLHPAVQSGASTVFPLLPAAPGAAGAGRRVFEESVAAALAVAG